MIRASRTPSTVSFEDLRVEWQHTCLEGVVWVAIVIEDSIVLYELVEVVAFRM